MSLYFKKISLQDSSIKLPEMNFYVLPGEITALYIDTEIQQGLLRVLEMRETPYTGSVFINTKELSKKEARKHIGYFQKEFGLYERLTVKEWLTFWRRIYRSPRSVAGASRQVQLESRLFTKISALSFSEKKRLQFCLLLFQQPDIIIMEEWDQNLDVESKKILLPLLHDLKNEGAAVLVLTANMESALTCADNVYQISSGKITKIHTEDKEPEPEDAAGLTFTKIPAKINEKIILFNPPEIDYIESREGKVLLYINNEEFPCSFTLMDLEKKLKNYGFFRCHRSYIVNLQKVREVITWTRNSFSLELDDAGKNTVPLSKSKMEELKEMLGLK
ncbi:LytTR family transcriptional regulator DNA-binding domain-containing protein [Alkalicoccus saliphilus]|uniref:ABC transporter ATP-binding protein n=1 Tax=Alkalicoccus saliphilus TaxID=200989 RepID=A0A2T4U1P2_9BACI|nr:LytTR family transcriptional regulator DNA-binding domain-containing protein [Alkalicoccus saliphilus]PTL37316.1 ABC transporter ATP-binding protein [Alkalicoccus saliphilus]